MEKRKIEIARAKLISNYTTTQVSLHFRSNISPDGHDFPLPAFVADQHHGHYRAAFMPPD
jgi:hypothetical protein